MIIRPNPIKTSLLFLNMIVHGLLVLILFQEEGLHHPGYAAIGISLFISLYKFFTLKKRAFIILTVIHPLGGLYLLWLFSSHSFMIFLYTGLLIIEGSIFLILPWSILASLYPVIIQLMFYKFWFVTELERMPQLFLVQYFFSLFIFCIFTALAIHYREILIIRNREIILLKDTLINLNRVNRDFQDSLFRISSQSAESERKRITRDIHDLVGYTMTNNIVLMEMATDLMKTDPLEVSRLINTARSNAQNGLEEIRSILYNYRQENPQKSEGMRALSRQINVFKTAAAIDIRLNLGNCPQSFNWDLDSTIYHVIQEAMLNSYCHGRATRIDIFLNVNKQREIIVNIQDNGSGAENLIEGIGLKGMRERLEQLGGNLCYENNNFGFLITGIIPIEKDKLNG